MRKLLADIQSQNQLIVNTVLVVSITSVMFVYPFDNYFRLTFGVVTISLSLLYFRQLPIIPTAIFSALGIFFTRMAIDIGFSDSTVWTSMAHAFPALVYYICFGCLFFLLDLRSSSSNPHALAGKLSLIDLVSNMLELAIRDDFFSGSATMMPELAAAAVIRALLTLYGYYLLKRYKAFVLAEEHFNRYSQLILIFAELKTELYYLKKSSRDIEEVMARSYRLYQALAPEQKPAETQESLRVEALTIAKDIHEIKHDYYRVAGGMDQIINASHQEQGMPFQDIFRIIEQNTKRFLEDNPQRLILRFHCQDNWVTSKHYNLVSILNNLIVNAIEAAKYGGIITISEKSKDESIFFAVEDDGCGIEEDDHEVIFKPGYSTKYSEATGTLSTGLGLTHTKALVELLGGRIRMESLPDVYTAFHLEFNRRSLVEER